jgi:hypothetical protein
LDCAFFPLSKDFLKDAERYVLAIQVAGSRHDIRLHTEGCICSVTASRYSPPAVTSSAPRTLPLLPSKCTAPSPQSASRPSVPGQHPHGFQGNSGRPIRGHVVGFRLVDDTRGGAGPSAFDLKIWRGKPDRGRHRPLVARGLSAGKPAPGTTTSPPLPLVRPRPLRGSSAPPSTAPGGARGGKRPPPPPPPPPAQASSWCRQARRDVPLRSADLSDHLTVGADPGRAWTLWHSLSAQVLEPVCRALSLSFRRAEVGAGGKRRDQNWRAGVRTERA